MSDNVSSTIIPDSEKLEDHVNAPSLEDLSVGRMYGVMLEKPSIGNCKSSLGKTWSGYKDPFPTLVDPRLNIRKSIILRSEITDYADQSGVSVSGTTDMAAEYTRRLRETCKNLPSCYPVSRLTQHLLSTYENMVSHPTYTRRASDVDVVLFHDEQERQHKIAVTEGLWSLEKSDEMYDALCLYNADFSRTFPVANVIHQGFNPDVDKSFPTECVMAYGEQLQRFIIDQLSKADLDQPLAKINEEKGLGFYAFHPDGRELSPTDKFVTAVEKLLPRLPNGKPYNDGCLAYHVKNTRLLRMEWQRSERIDDIWDWFTSHRYVEDVDAFLHAFKLGAVMVQTDGERRNQVDTFKNRADLEKDVSVWRRNACGKNRRISFESEPLRFSTFRRDDQKFEEFSRRKVGFDSKGCRARPVKGQPSTTLGPVLNALNRLVWHHVESTGVGLPSYRKEFLQAMDYVGVTAEMSGREVIWLRSDDENSEQLATLAGERLMCMYHGNLRTVMENESLSVHPSLFGPLVVPYSLMSGDPFTTWKNVTKGMLTTIRSVCFLFGLQYNKENVGEFAQQIFDIFSSGDHTKYIRIKSARGSEIWWFPKMGTDDQVQPLLFLKNTFRRSDYDKAVKLSALYGTELEIGPNASGYGCHFDGATVTVSTPAQIGKLEYFELGKKHRSSALQAFTFYQRLKLLSSEQVSIIENSYRKLWGSDFSELPNVERWFYEEVIRARGYPIPALFNQYSPVDQVAFADLMARLEGDGDSYYWKDDIGKNLSKLIEFIVR